MVASEEICKLECIKEKNVHEFVGPVKIVFVQPTTGQYIMKQLNAAFIALANMVLGATVAGVVLFTLKFLLPLYNNFHVFLCTIGGQLFMPLAILMQNNRFGAAAPLTKSGMRFQHIFLQFFAMSSLIGGAVVFVILEKRYQGLLDPKLLTAHSIFGCICCCMPLLTGILGVIVFLTTKAHESSGFCTIVHRILGVLTFISSSACFITGVMKPVIKIWGKEIPIVLSSFCAFYTIVIVFTPLTRCLGKKNM